MADEHERGSRWQLSPGVRRRRGRRSARDSLHATASILPRSSSPARGGLHDRYPHPCFCRRPRSGARRRQSAPLAGYAAKHFQWALSDGIAAITLNRPSARTCSRSNSYAELRDCSSACASLQMSRLGRCWCCGRQLLLGGDVDEIIGPLVRLKAPSADVHAHDRDLVKAMRVCRQPIVAVIDGVCAGAGAILVMAVATCASAPRGSKTAFLFNRVGLAGCDMGACAMLPRIVGQGRRERAALHRPGACSAARRVKRWASSRSRRAGARRRGDGAREGSLPLGGSSPTASPRRCCIRSGR